MTDFLAQTSEGWLLASLFAGALLDALPGPCLFVFGEVFFLMAGNLAHETGSSWPVLAVLAGALTADQTGYFLGSKMSGPLRRVALRTSRRRAAWRRARAGLEARAILFVAGSRLMGPVAWITPTLAGSLDISWLRFSIGSFLGVLIGVGQFVLYGWLLAAGSGLIGFDLGRFVMTHAASILIGTSALGLVSMLIWRRLASCPPSVR